MPKIPARLANLPVPPAGKEGWPWTKESAPLPATAPDGGAWPRISIVTPSLNQGQFLEETLRSILLQNYLALELIVIDGGSTDASPEILGRYAPFLDTVRQEPTAGHADAVNRGLAQATGEIVAFLNSDDFYLPGALGAVAARFRSNPPADLVYGGCLLVEQDGREFMSHHGNVDQLDDLLDFIHVWQRDREIVQPEAFWRRSFAEKIGPLNTKIPQAYVYEYWCRLQIAGAKFHRIDPPLACYRYHPAQRSQRENDRSFDDYLAMAEKWLWDAAVPLTRARRRALQADWAFHSKYAPAIARSSARQDPQWRQWVSTASLCLRYPPLTSRLPQVSRLRDKLKRPPDKA